MKSTRPLGVIPGLLLVASVIFFGCTTPKDEGDEPANNYVFPKLKYSDSGEFSLTKEERKVALRELRRKRGELLYELVVDRKGKVTKIRVVKELEGQDDYYFTASFMQRIQTHRFNPSRMTAAYRTFFFPMNVKSSVDFRSVNDAFTD